MDANNIYMALSYLLSLPWLIMRTMSFAALLLNGLLFIPVWRLSYGEWDAAIDTYMRMAAAAIDRYLEDVII